MNTDERLEHLEKSCKSMKKTLEKIVKNDLPHLELRAENTEGWLSRFEWNINVMWKTYAGSSVMLGIVIALCQLLG